MQEGFLRLASRLAPSLSPGKYTLKASQTTNIPRAQVEPEAFAFQCDVNPLALTPEDVYSCYPPKEAFGQFGHVLPHIVFTRKSLPWARGIPGVENAPWLALLLFAENEGAVLRDMPCKDAFEPDPAVYCPTRYEADMGEHCLVLDVPAALFSAVCPLLSDLPLTAHARCASRENKVTEASPLDEWLSALIGTRTPLSAVGEAGVKNSCHVVSLERFGPFLSDRRLPPQCLTVRVPVLHTWSFYSAAQDFDFKTVFEGLDAGPLALFASRPGALPEGAANLLKMGYAPLDHQLREGGSTVSWYRGPLIPFSGRVNPRPVCLNADARLIYEPELGMFDISYSAAFTLGRLLGLEAGSYAAALNQWRGEHKHDANRRLQREAVMDALHLDAEGQMGARLTAAVRALLDAGGGGADE